MNKIIQMLSVFAMILTPFLSVQKAIAGPDPLLGEISYFAGNFAPRGWAFCNGQLLPINQNSALFSLLGTQYGGDGRTTFALPDMRGRVALHKGQGPGLSNHPIGQKTGTETITALPQHSHTMSVSSDTASSTVATGRSLATTETYTDASPNVSLHASTLSTAGGGQDTIDNIQPSVTAQCIIALVGIFPSPS